MQVPFYQEFTTFIQDIFMELQNIFLPLGIPFGWMAWLVIVTVSPLMIIILVLFRKSRRAGGDVPEGVKAIIASTGDVSAGMTGAKRLKFIKSPNDALIFLKIEENAIQQALSAIDYFIQRGELDEPMKDQLTTVYQSRLDSVRTAIEKDEELKSIVATDDAIDKARSDYLRKLAAMSGTTVEVDTEDIGPSSVGMPSDTGTQATTQADTITELPSDGAAPGGAPVGGPPGGAPVGGPPGGAAPVGGPPGGAAPVGAPVGGTPSGGTPSADIGGKSSLQSEMLAEMERLKALMSGD